MFVFQCDQNLISPLRASTLFIKRDDENKDNPKLGNVLLGAGKRRGNSFPSGDQETNSLNDP